MKFRRAAPRLVATRLDYEDAAELVAFVLTIGVKPARWIFQWDNPSRLEMHRLLEHLKDDPHVVAMVEENHRDTTRDDGLKCLRAMQDGGWRQGGVPRAVRMAVLDLVDEGHAMWRIGERLGLSVDQIRVICHGSRVKAHLPGLGHLVAG